MLASARKSRALIQMIATLFSFAPFVTLIVGLVLIARASGSGQRRLSERATNIRLGIGAVLLAASLGTLVMRLL